VLPRLGYGWLGSAFDGFEADTKTGKPSRRLWTALARLGFKPRLEA
jgi:hypothetical protein